MPKQEQEKNRSSLIQTETTLEFTPDEPVSLKQDKVSNRPYIKYLEATSELSKGKLQKAHIQFLAIALNLDDLNNPRVDTDIKLSILNASKITEELYGRDEALKELEVYEKHLSDSLSKKTSLFDLITAIKVHTKLRAIEIDLNATVYRPKSDVEIPNKSTELKTFNDYEVTGNILLAKIAILDNHFFDAFKSLKAIESLPFNPDKEAETLISVLEIFVQVEPYFLNRLDSHYSGIYSQLGALINDDKLNNDPDALELERRYLVAMTLKHINEKDYQAASSFIDDLEAIYNEKANEQESREDSTISKYRFSALALRAEVELSKGELAETELSLLLQFTVNKHEKIELIRLCEKYNVTTDKVEQMISEIEKYLDEVNPTRDPKEFLNPPTPNLLQKIGLQIRLWVDSFRNK